MNARSCSFVIFPLAVILSAIGTSWGQSPMGIENDTLQKIVLPLVKEFGKERAFVLEYDRGLELQGGSFRVWRHKYIQSGKMWREEMRDEKGNLQMVTSYDGERYYHFNPVGLNLHVTRDPDEPDFVRTDVANAFFNSPHSGWVMPFFMFSKSSLESKGIADLTTWSDALVKYVVKEVDSKEGDLRLHFESPFFQFETEFFKFEDGLLRVNEIVLRHKNKATGEFIDVQTRVRLTGWHQIKVGGETITLPKEMIQESRLTDGSEVVGGDAWSRLVDGSVKALPASVGKAAFRVPLSAVPDPRIWE